MPNVVINLLPQVVSGPVTLGPSAVQAGTKQLVMAGVLSALDAANVLNSISYDIQGSYDGGVTFRSMVRSTWQGGLDRQNNPCPPGLSWTPGTVPDHVQVLFNLAQSLNFGATVTLS